MARGTWDQLRRSSRRRLTELRRAAVGEREPEPPVAGSELVEDQERAADADLVPRSVRAAAAWSWRLLLVAALVALVGWAAGHLSEVVVPLLTAVLFTAALTAVNGFLRRHRWPPWAAALTSMLLLILVVGGLLTLVGAQIALQWSVLTVEARNGFREVILWLGAGPLHISTDQLNAWFNQVVAALQESRTTIASRVAAAGVSIGRFLAGALMCIFATFFFLKDGAKIVSALLRPVPFANRRLVERVAGAGWGSLFAYVRAAITVAAVDGVGAGIGAFALGSELWLAIMSLTFVCAFVPVLGAMVAGSVGVLVVLVTLGPVKAFIMFGVFVAVLAIEAHILQPVLLGHAVSIHPLMVLVGISVGVIVAGIEGAVFAIPLMAFLGGMLRAGSAGRAQQGQTPDQLPPDVSAPTVGGSTNSVGSEAESVLAGGSNVVEDSAAVTQDPSPER